MAHLAGLGEAPAEVPEPLAMHGVHDLGIPEIAGRPLAVIVLYRAYLLASDIAPIDALAHALDRQGLNVRALFVGSLKEAASARFVAEKLRVWRPRVVLNATAFSARLDDAPSPLEAAGAPILQIVLAGSSEEAWRASARGLSQADLAMQVVLPELDGRLLAGAVSFKADKIALPELEFSGSVHAAWEEGVTAVARSAAAWCASFRNAASGAEARAHSLGLSRRRRSGRTRRRPRRDRQRFGNSRSP